MSIKYGTNWELQERYVIINNTPTKVSSVYIWNWDSTATKIRPVWWRPWANTVAYYPLTSTSTVNDMSGNELTLTNNWNAVFWTYDWVDCAYFNWNASLRQSSLTTQYIWQTFTFMAWMKVVTECNVWTYNNQWTNRGIWLVIQNNNDKIWGSIWQWGSFLDVVYNTTINNTWYLIWLTHNSNWDLKLYFNGVQVQTGSWAVNEWASNFAIWAAVFKESEIYYSNGYVSNVIIEDKERTDQEVSEYYNLTKWNYWL